MLTHNSNEFKLSRTLDMILNHSKNNYSLKKVLKRGMNNIENTYKAFNSIATNKGSGTEGVDNKTIDGIKLEMIKKYHKEYVNNQYNPQPVKKVLIPKDKNKTRPLGIPTIKDRIIQKAMEQLLTLYFENIFSE
ncbi:Group II intron-encoded protein ltrA [Strawberry lethal yellows phytoplasma (CPA) str. NZSb11]|nr:Group II intron-encoded protein ltrA [Strawberry lethal yellows phytoplasma (CPA) str. NZSb11]